MTLKLLIHTIAKIFENKKHIESPFYEARVLVTDLLDISSTDYLLNSDTILINETQISLVEKAAEKRINGSSIASITGYKDFYTSRLKVNNHVLIPRPDTEILVEYCIETIQKNQYQSMLEIGCGPGTISISILKECNLISIDAIDISEEALKLCKENRELNNISNDRLKITLGDIFSYTYQKKYDILVSNPPYIPEDVVLKLLEKYEVDDPLLALSGGKDGLDFYRQIANSAYKYILPGGQIILEHGYDQKENVKNIFVSSGFKYGCSIKDYGNNDRVSIFYPAEEHNA